MIESSNEQNRGVCFIDSNIWLYAFIEVQDTNKSSIAKSIIQRNSTLISISTQIINEVCVNLIKKADFSEENIQGLIESFHDNYNVIGLDRDVFINASKVREHHSFSFWDSLVFAAAMHAGAEILYSEDMQDGFVLENIEIVNPFKR